MAPRDAANAIGTRRRLSRRRLLALSGGATAVALGATACGDETPGPATPSPSTPRVAAPPAVDVLAANVNEALNAIDFGQLADVAGTWVRGFHVMSGADHGDPAHQTGLSRLLQAAAHGYGTVLTLKFQYRNQVIPRPGSPAMATALARLDRVLAATMGRVDILTVGNEPFFETRPADRTTHAINAFYEALALHTARHRQEHGGNDSRTRIYLGALTGLDQPGADTAQTRRWLAFAAATPSIAGVDIHPHVASAAGAQRYVDYVLPYLRPDQSFLATEFSLVRLWKRHLGDAVDADFARRSGLAAGTPVWRFLDRVTRSPVSERQWNDFVLSCPWFAANRDFLTGQLARFRKTGKLAVAGYGLVQAEHTRGFGPDGTPWVLNCVFPQYVTTAGADGLPGRNRTWWAEFRAAQQR